ncbi:MAG: class I SAM-dependent methyltransferase [Flavitalea sp.]
MIRYGRCPVCDSSAISKALSAKDNTVTNESFEIWQCANCSLRFTQDVPNEIEIVRYYRSETYISHSNSSKGIVNSIYLIVRNFTLRSKRKFIERITGLKKGTILDVGAGTGAFLSNMQKGGWYVEGVEPDDSAIKKARLLHGLILKPSAALFQLSQKGYDVITMWHVLEHVHSLHQYIEQLKLLCKARGKILIAVPNYTSNDGEHYLSDWAAYDVPRHLYHFSPASMHALMQKHGCTIQHIYPMWLDSFYVSMLSEKYKKSSFQLFRGFWNGLQSNSKALRNNRRASSLIYEITI